MLDRCRFCFALGVSLVLAWAPRASAQSITLTGPATTTVVEGDDFFTTTAGNRLEFEDASTPRRDFLWEENFSEPTINVSGGIWSAANLSTDGYVFPVFSGFAGALNYGPDGRQLGEHLPVDTTKYKVLSFRRKVSNRTTYQVAVGGTVDFAVTSVCVGADGYFTNSQLLKFDATRFTVDVLDFRNTNPSTMLCTASGTSGPWTGQVRNVRIEPSTGGVAGTTTSFDWVRISDPTSAPNITVSWTTAGLTTTNGVGQPRKVHVFVDSDATGFDGDLIGRVDMSAGSFTLPSSTLPPGTWRFYVEVHSNQDGDTVNATSAYSNPVTINGRPVLHVDNPSMTSGEDYATAVRQDPWDFNELSDVANLGRTQAEKRFTNPAISGGAFTALADPPAGGASESDVQVWMPIPSNQPILTHKYRYLTWSQSLDSTGWGNISDKVSRGFLGRHIWWNTGIHEDGSSTAGAPIYEGVHSYTLDLAGNGVLAADDPFPANTGWLGNATISNFRFDPAEYVASAPSRNIFIQDLKIRARPEPVNNAFTIQVTTTDPENNPSTIQYFRDTDNVGFNGTLLGTQTTQFNGAHSFGFSTAAEFPKDFYIYVVVTDSAGNVTRAYGDAPVHVGPQTWHSFFAVDALETPYVGDFNGDGKTDIITFTRQNPNAFGDVYVSLSTGTSFQATSQKWHDFFAINTSEQVIIGDYNNDGKDDIATWLSTTSRQVYVALSTGVGMTQETVWVNSIGSSSTDVLASGDVNGDGRDDMICFARTEGKVYVALSNGTSFGTPTVWHNFFAVSTFERPRVADVNGDGKADIVTFATDSPSAFGDVFVATSNGVNQFGDKQNSDKWADFFAIRQTEEIRIGDLNKDGRQDFFTFLPAPFGQAYTVLSQGTSMGGNNLWVDEDLVYFSTDKPFVGDVNGDGKADIILFRQVPGEVKVVLTP
jgi:hypothetical protein